MAPDVARDGFGKGTRSIRIIVGTAQEVRCDAIRNARQSRRTVHRTLKV